MTEVEPYSRLAGVYDDIVVDPCFASWADFLDHLWSLGGMPVTEVLDVCCGTGLMAAELGARGYRVTGLDASAAMLDRARAVVGPGVALLHQSLPDIHVPGMFDAAISTYDGLNYLSPHDLEATLDRLSDIIRPSGWLVFDLHTDAMFTLALDTPQVVMDWQGRPVTIDYEADRDARTCTSRITMTDAAGSFTETHPQFMHPDDLVRRLLGQSGFGSVAVLDAYQPRPATGDTLRATWVARRSPEP